MSSTSNGCKTGIPGFDEVLAGGLIAQRMYLLDGNPGAGKTTFAMQFLMQGVREGEKCLYITLSETVQELRAAASSHDWSLDGIDIVELIVDETELHGDAQLTMLLASEVELTETTRKLIEAVDRINPSRLVLDSLSELRLLAQNSLRYRRQILALKQLFLGRHCTVVMLDDRTAEGPDMQLHSIAHGVISLESKAPAYGPVRRELQVRKFRGSNFASGFHDFNITREGIVVFPRLVAAEHFVKYSQGLVQSGVASLDALMGGGVDRGTSTLLLGPPGCGKSTIALQYAVAAVNRGDHAAVFMFDETKSSLLTRCTGLGMKIRVGDGKGELALRQIDPAEVSPGEFVSLVRAAVENNSASVVVIDSLNGYLTCEAGGVYQARAIAERCHISPRRLIDRESIYFCTQRLTHRVQRRVRVNGGQHLAGRHAKQNDSLFAKVLARIEPLDGERVLKSRGGLRKAHTVFGKIRGFLCNNDDAIN
jgi:circadian clock protein KaiC